MSKGRQKIRFEGLLQKNVLGTFSVIRGFADLRDLAAVSIAIPYEGSGMGSGTGYQRALDETKRVRSCNQASMNFINFSLFLLSLISSNSFPETSPPQDFSLQEAKFSIWISAIGEIHSQLELLKLITYYK